MLTWDDDLRLSDTDLYLNSRIPRETCFVSHAHSDHISLHEQSFGTPQTKRLVGHRLGPGAWVELPYAEPFSFSDDVTLRTLPAGHVLGSAMLHATTARGTLLYTGDFKLRPSRTVPAARLPDNLEGVDALIMETTYGRPQFTFPPAELIADELCDLVGSALRDGRQPIVLGYSLGKAQEITRILTDAGFAVTTHGAVHSMNKLYESMGVPLGATRKYAREDFHGEKALDLAERGVLVAPPQCARSAFTTGFAKRFSIMMTGWALSPGATFRYGVDHALPLSDHADYNELLQLVERVRPKRVYTHHGYAREFADVLNTRGFNATPARPERQMRLFD